MIGPLDIKGFRVRKLTPTEYGRLQAFPMQNWKQVVSDSQAYKQFGNAVTTTVVTAIAQHIKAALDNGMGKENETMKEVKEFVGKAVNEKSSKKEIKVNQLPQVEVRIHVTEEMEQDFKECQEMFRTNPDDEKDCGSCSWNGKGSKFAVRLCELPTVSEKMKEVGNSHD